MLIFSSSSGLGAKIYRQRGGAVRAKEKESRSSALHKQCPANMQSAGACRVCDDKFIYIN